MAKKRRELDPEAMQKKAAEMKAWRLEMKEARKRTMARIKSGEVVPQASSAGKAGGKAGKGKGKSASHARQSGDGLAEAKQTEDKAKGEEEMIAEPPKKKKRIRSTAEASNDAVSEPPKEVKKKKRASSEQAEASEMQEQQEQPVPKKTKKTFKRNEAEEHSGAAVEASTDPEAYKVCVAGIPPSISEETLRKDFGVCGEVLSLRLLRDKETKKSRGIAFISFTTEAGLDAALEYNGEDYGGRFLWVKVAEKTGSVDGKAKGKGKIAGPGPKPPGCTSVILKGLAFSVTEADLKKAFKSCGDGPTNVSILTDRDTGVSKGMAFVDFDDEAAVDEAIKLHGTELKGRRFSMDYATPREKSRGPGSKPAGCTSVVVKGLDYSVTEADLTKKFRNCGTGPVNVRLATDKEGVPRGIAFLDFASEDAVDEAIKLHGGELKGRRFVMDYALPRDDSGKPGAEGEAGKAKGPGKKPAGCTSIIVKDLAEAVTDKTLMQTFKACGEGPRNVNLVMDKDTGEFTGSAFVNFSSESAVDEAIKLTGTEVEGQCIRIGFVKPKKREK